MYMQPHHQIINLRVPVMTILVLLQLVKREFILEISYYFGHNVYNFCFSAVGISLLKYSSLRERCVVTYACSPRYFSPIVSVKVSPIKVSGTYASSRPDFPHIGHRFAIHILK